jgi:signal transduction histidine kinase
MIGLEGFHLPIQMTKTKRKTQHIRLLLIEDNPDDATFIEEVLKLQDMYAAVDIAVVGKLRDGIAWLGRENFDIVLLDLSLPDASSTDSVRRILDEFPQAAIIVLTGLDDRDVAIEALKKGAQDYLIKDGVSGDLLIRSIRYAVERRRAEQAARARAAQEREDLIFTLANDLRVPHIGAIRAFDLLVDETLGPLNPDQKSLLLKVKQSSHEVLHMLQNLVQLYRHEQASQKFLAVPTDLERLVKQVIDDWSFMAAENNVEVSVVQDFPEPVLVDAPCFKKALSNLLHNAIKFSSPNGKVTITCSRDDRFVSLTVKDNGKGLSEEHQASLFQRFWQENDNMRHSNGSGVGLYVCRQIVEAHAGTITCRSTPGEGATFEIKIPYLAR